MKARHGWGSTRPSSITVVPAPDVEGFTTKNIREFICFGQLVDNRVLARKRLEFFYVEAGGGHKSAATALKAVIDSQNRPWDVTLH
jgi:hypothetical protein